MLKKITKKYLINFENNIATIFNEAKIKAPIHLYNGNEANIIKVFKKIKKNDWVFCSWRSHYQCLLKGVPEKDLIKSIIKGKSISLIFPKYKVFSSGIVGGNLPIAVGVALSLKNKKSNSKVFCFLGDMTAETGIFHECLKYSMNFNLPIHFIIEDNDLSVFTKTQNTWGQKKSTFENNKNKFITYYKYNSKYPHSGTGTRVVFF